VLKKTLSPGLTARKASSAVVILSAKGISVSGNANDGERDGSWARWRLPKTFLNENLLPIGTSDLEVLAKDIATRWKLLLDGLKRYPSGSAGMGPDAGAA
jgi:hypothetical protein